MKIAIFKHLFSALLCWLCCMHLLSGIQAVVRQPLGGERRPIRDAAHQVSNQQANLAQLAVVQCEVQVVRGRRSWSVEIYLVVVISEDKTGGGEEDRTTNREPSPSFGRRRGGLASRTS